MASMECGAFRYPMDDASSGSGHLVIAEDDEYSCQAGYASGLNCVMDYDDDQPLDMSKSRLEALDSRVSPPLPAAAPPISRPSVITCTARAACHQHHSHDSTLPQHSAPEAPHFLPKAPWRPVVLTDDRPLRVSSESGSAALSAPKIATVSPQQRIDSTPTSNSSHTTTSTSSSMCDSVIEEHFRRSLGKQYAVLMGESEQSTAKKTEEAQPDTVDDHFARALGDTWHHLKQKEQHNRPNNS